MIAKVSVWLNAGSREGARCQQLWNEKVETMKNSSLGSGPPIPYAVICPWGMPVNVTQLNLWHRSLYIRSYMEQKLCLYCMGSLNKMLVSVIQKEIKSHVLVNLWRLEVKPWNLVTHLVHKVHLWIDLHSITIISEGSFALVVPVVESFFYSVLAKHAWLTYWR